MNSRNVGSAAPTGSFVLQNTPYCWRFGSVQELLFENRIALLATLGLIEFVLLWTWARWRTRLGRRMVLGGLVAACLLLAIQTLVVTHRERIISICRELALAIEDGNIDAFGRKIAQEFASDEIDREALLVGLARILDRVHVEATRLSGFEVTVDGDRAWATFRARCRLVTSEQIEGGVISRWKLTFRRNGDRWLVVSIQPIRTPLFPYQKLGEAIHAG